MTNDAVANAMFGKLGAADNVRYVLQALTATSPTSPTIRIHPDSAADLIACREA
eukprot:SAG11_NODE_37371_length_257_cov_0.658228_1_plen_53_part_10